MNSLMGRIPRRNRRGLIEAGTGYAALLYGPERFPGEIAGASLKLIHPSSDEGFLAAGFPGEIAGASLKRALRGIPVVLPPLTGFPGEIAGASLKRPSFRDWGPEDLQ